MDILLMIVVFFTIFVFPILISDSAKSIRESIKTFTIKLLTINLTKMKTKYLYKALRFALLPSLVFLIVLCFAFFSITDTLAFIASERPGAVFTRIILVIVEVVLVFFMYRKYEQEGIAEDIEKGLNTSDTGYSHVGYDREVAQMFGSSGYSNRDKYEYEYKQTRVGDVRYVIIKQNKK